MFTGQHLDIACPVPAPPAIVPGTRTDANRFLGVRFDCCGAYSRVYANRSGSAYVGYCPRCARRVEFQIGPGGSDSRFFSVS